MTIQIPDDLAKGLEALAAAQRKSVEQVAVESLRSLFDRASSPVVVLRSVRASSRPSPAVVDDLEVFPVLPVGSMSYLLVAATVYNSHRARPVRW
jgi:hypothetical protein